MQAQSSGPLATFLMFIPLVAVPCLAVFGVPDLDSFSAAEAEDDADTQALKDVHFARDSDEPRDLLKDGTSAGQSHSADRLATAANGVPSHDRDQADGRSEHGLFDTNDLNTRSNPLIDGDFPLESGSNAGIPFTSGDNRPMSRSASSGDDRETSDPSARSRQTKTWSPPDHIRHDWEPDRSARSSDDARSRDDELADAHAEASAAGVHRQRALHETSGSTRLSANDAVGLDDSSGSRVAADFNPFDTSEASSPGPHAAGSANAGARDQDSPFTTVEDNDGQALADDKAAKSSTTKGRTWQDAVRRLKELGIQQYQLSPGVHENEVHFSCTLVPQEGTRVVRRFEAEAGDPVAAVDDVLAQIQQWQHAR